MKRLKCDKPYNLDEVRKRKGLPRRKREDPRTTAYELNIRIPNEYQAALGKKKVSKTVYALNKKEDLKKQKEEFEEETNAVVEGILMQHGVIPGRVESVTAATPLKDFTAYYIGIRSNGSVQQTTIKNELSTVRYTDETIGHIPVGKLTPQDIEECLLMVPQLSERWALERQHALEENRKTAKWIRKNGSNARPLKPIKVAGPDKQHKVLKFLREALNFAIEKECIEKNPAKAKYLGRLFKKGKPLIDPLMEDEAARLLGMIDLLPTGFFKVAMLILLDGGVRPEEVIALRPGDFVFGEDETSINITGAIEHGTNKFKPYPKTDAGRRSVPIDDETAKEVLKWIEVLRGELADLGIRFTMKTPLISNTGSFMTYNTFNNRWKRFTRNTEFEGKRLYCLRHTFATINIANGENIKMIAAIMGHKNSAYTLDLYAAYVPNTGIGLGRRYMLRLRTQQQLQKAA